MLSTFLTAIANAIAAKLGILIYEEIKKSGVKMDYMPPAEQSAAPVEILNDAQDTNITSVN